MTSIFVVFEICKREHSGLSPQKEHDRPASHHEDANGRQREREAEMTELELDTLPRRKAARGAVVYIVMVILHHYILSVCLSLLLNGLLKISEKI